MEQTMARGSSMLRRWSSVVLALVILDGSVHFVGRTQAITRKFEFHVRYHNVSRLCATKPIALVNGQFPGPTVFAREGDHVLVKVSNQLPDKNMTIHWHGIRQLRTGWSDGPGYITQCPMQSGSSYTYNFTITGQRGTLWWHAHISWLRATVYGALVILPKIGTPYPFKTPTKEIPIILGEWWTANVEDVIKEAVQSGGVPNISDAYTINGQPGALHKCSSADTFVLPVVSGETYLLRIVNAAMNGELFFGVANHKMTVVEVDAVYTKPLETEYILIAPGQTTNVLITADQPSGKYYMAARPYIAPNVTLDNTTTTAILEYTDSSGSSSTPILPNLPALNDTNSAFIFSSNLRSLASSTYPAKVPQKIDRELFFTIGLGIKSCPPGQLCQGGPMLGAAINNISFVLPSTALLQAHYFNIPGVFTADFPDNPTTSFNYTGPQPSALSALQTQAATRLNRIPFNSRVQLVLQDTSFVAPENHPVHLHGFNFHVVGQGFGNYDRNTDPKGFNLVDPQERNTIGVPSGGWVALRFRADNPGVWFMHCHLELHNTWGLEMAFIVDNGVGPEQSVIPPPSDLPPC